MTTIFQSVPLATAAIALGCSFAMAQQPVRNDKGAEEAKGQRALAVQGCNVETTPAHVLAALEHDGAEPTLDEPQRCEQPGGSRTHDHHGRRRASAAVRG
mgnify:CR=1 FL=1